MGLDWTSAGAAARVWSTGDGSVTAEEINNGFTAHTDVCCYALNLAVKVPKRGSGGVKLGRGGTQC